jgi:hypothetical protein
MCWNYPIKIYYEKPQEKEYNVLFDIMSLQEQPPKDYKSLSQHIIIYSTHL